MTTVHNINFYMTVYINVCAEDLPKEEKVKEKFRHYFTDIYYLLLWESRFPNLDAPSYIGCI